MIGHHVLRVTHLAFLSFFGNLYILLKLLLVQLYALSILRGFVLPAPADDEHADYRQISSYCKDHGNDETCRGLESIHK